MIHKRSLLSWTSYPKISSTNLLYYPGPQSIKDNNILKWTFNNYKKWNKVTVPLKLGSEELKPQKSIHKFCNCNLNIIIHVPGLGVCMTIFKSDMCLLIGAQFDFRFSFSLSCTVGDTAETCIFLSFFSSVLQHFQSLVQSEIAFFGDQKGQYLVRRSNTMVTIAKNPKIEQTTMIATVLSLKKLNHFIIHVFSLHANYWFQ